MKKIAMVAVSIGVILVIAGLVVVGIFGGDALKDFSWDDFILNNHNLENANANIDTKTADLQGLQSIKISVDSYALYVLPSEEDSVSVKYVEPLKDGVKLDVSFDQGILTVTETDNLNRHFGGGMFNVKSDLFIAVYLPQTDIITGSELSVKASTTGIKVSDVAFKSVDCSVSTGSVKIANGSIANAVIEATTGSVNIDKLSCDNLTIKTNTGSVNIDETVAKENITLKTNTGSINCDAAANSFTSELKTGSVNFSLKANVLNIMTNTGSVNGRIIGDKTEYQIKVTTGSGKSNIENQTVANAVKFLTLEVDTGAVHIDFDNK